ncbi:uncharacterized protein [Argopecten irradians]|uniref:uncharacterized protein n=1 Tax=Argopecten irradians TaxID=31199 RepID=UPI00371D0A7D
MSCNRGSNWPVLKPKEKPHMLSIRRRSSLSGKRSFPGKYLDIEVPSTESSNLELASPTKSPISKVSKLQLSPLPSVNSVTLSPRPCSNQNSPIMQKKKLRCLPDIVSSSALPNSCSSPNSDSDVGNKCMAIQHEKETLTNAGKDETESETLPTSKHEEITSKEIDKSIRNTVDFLEYTSEDTDSGFQDVDLTIDPNSISIYF